VCIGPRRATKIAQPRNVIIADARLIAAAFSVCSRTARVEVHLRKPSRPAREASGTTALMQTYHVTVSRRGVCRLALSLMLSSQRRVTWRDMVVCVNDARVNSERIYGLRRARIHRRLAGKVVHASCVRRARMLYILLTSTAARDRFINIQYLLRNKCNCKQQEQWKVLQKP